MKLFLDIETLPAAGKDMPLIKQFYEESQQRRYPSNMKTSFETFVRNTSFSGEFGRILCIGYACDDKPSEAFEGDEKEMLLNFWELAKDASLFIGHNVMEFDLRFIYKRSVINDVKPTRDLNFARYRSDPIFDTMKEWEKWGSQGCSLHRLSLALGLSSPKEEGIDGSKVYDYYLEGRTEEIVEYCKRDVEATRQVYKKMTFSG